jgi:hypothetical protein
MSAACAGALTLIAISATLPSRLLLGPEALVIYTPGHWVIGAVISNSW